MRSFHLRRLLLGLIVGVSVVSASGQSPPFYTDNYRRFQDAVTLRERRIYELEQTTREYERRLQEQERRIVEQERRIQEQERVIQEMRRRIEFGR